VEFNVSTTSGVLYVIGTPIGNLQDISTRAQSILREVALILAEDTRHSKTLLNHLNINTPMRSYHEHNEIKALPLLLQSLRQGTKMALISDAGTPLISDPGFPLVKAALEMGIRVSPIPGPSALIAALSVSGLPTDKFIFEGFLPAKPAARKKHLQSLLMETRTMVFFEATHRIMDLLLDINEVFGGDRIVSVCRELTKKFETIFRSRISSILDIMTRDTLQQKGEFVVILEGGEKDRTRNNGELEKIIRVMLNHGVSVKNASAIAAEITGARKKESYEMALKLKRD
jgi:16S rRNA (cytidine1402-2'-O)-methyltransferase